MLLTVLLQTVAGMIQSSPYLTVGSLFLFFPHRSFFEPQKGYFHPGGPSITKEMDLLRLKRSGGKKKNKKYLSPSQSSEKREGGGSRASARSRFQSGSFPSTLPRCVRSLSGRWLRRLAKQHPLVSSKQSFGGTNAPIAWKLTKKAFLSRENHLRVKGAALLKLHVLGDNPVDIMDVK